MVIYLVLFTKFTMLAMNLLCKPIPLNIIINCLPQSYQFYCIHKHIKVQTEQAGKPVLLEKNQADI